MESLGELLRRVWFFLNSRSRDREVREEMEQHIALKIEASVAAGGDPEDAKYAALRQFGNPTLQREQAHEAWGFGWLETLLQDIRYGLRILYRNPGFTLATVITLALGIGLNTAVFSIVDAVLLKPLPYPERDRLVAFRGSQSLPDVIDIAEQSRSLSSVAAYADWPLDLVGNSEPERVDGAMIGGDMFSALGTPPAIGRIFGEAEDRRMEPVVVSSYAFWKTHLGGDRTAIGRPLQLSGKDYTLIGVMPPEFQLPKSKSQLWIPFRVAYPEAVDARGAHFMFALGQLGSGYTMAQAQSELDQIGAALGKLHPEEARTFTLVALRDRVVGSVKTPLLVLFGAAGLVLLIACSNFASLLMARTVARAQEMKIRSAIGAGQPRLVRQLLTECVLIAMLGAGLGILVAVLGLHFLLSMKPDEVAAFQRITIDRAALGFAIISATITGLIFGLPPAFAFLRSSRVAESSRVVGRTGVRKTLVIAQVGLSLILLASAGLLIRSFWRLQSVPLGFEPEGVLSLRMTLPAARYAAIATQEQFLVRLDNELNSMPEVESAGIVTELPLGGSRMMHNMIVRDLPPVPEGQEPEIYAHEVSRDYFATMRIQMLAGRGFTLQDGPKAPPVGVVNQAFAQRFFPTQNVIGKEVRWARANDLPWITIVGVVRDVRAEALDESQEPTIYTPFIQKVMPWKRSQVVVVRGRGGSPVDPNAIRNAIWKLDNRLPITDVLPLRDVISESVKERRFNMILLTIFAGLAFTLASIGVYGVVAYLVSQRTREIGVRVALGAQRVDILWLVLRQGLQLLFMGAVLGLCGALLSSSLLRDMVYGIGVTDGATFFFVVVALIFIGVLATYIPARRASRLDPMTALRVE